MMAIAFKEITSPEPADGWVGGRQPSECNFDLGEKYMESSDPSDALTLLGFVGLSDPPKEHVASSVLALRQAGIKVRHSIIFYVIPQR